MTDSHNIVCQKYKSPFVISKDILILVIKDLWRLNLFKPHLKYYQNKGSIVFLTDYKLNTQAATYLQCYGNLSGW